MQTVKPEAPATQATGGSGARERILRAATHLFYERGIHATGVAALVDAAHVSTRTFYQHFESKEALVAEYLRELTGAMESERQLSREDLPPADRLLAIFTLEEMLAAPASVRGCPFHNAAVEAAGEMPEVAHLVEQHKQAFRGRLAAVAAEAGAADPAALARQLAVIYEGATALAASCNDPGIAADARAAAAALLTATLPATSLRIT